LLSDPGHFPGGKNSASLHASLKASGMGMAESESLVVSKGEVALVGSLSPAGFC